MTGRFQPAPGERLYAIGDVHGCAELFAQLVARISADTQSRPPAVTRIIVLGDVVDRGPASRDLVLRLMRYAKASDRFIVLMGNHEQVMTAALNGDVSALRAWLAVGGDATLKSWGVEPALIAEGASEALLTGARRAIGAEVVLWLERRPISQTSGDLLFVHAGVRPGIPLAQQSVQDMLWIREPFLESDEERSFLVVHGHTVTPFGPDIRDNRIGVDTGAYRTGRLSAVAFEGGACWTLST